ncbi:DUF4352 domain-containing protein [Streptosporangium sp. NPDC002524]|uniref:DUF4352 domain-containing protein n=1 Tax=Streptosporangium sp. NPDC002524 TaxID=3154537 RepID=UPI00332E22B5
MRKIRIMLPGAALACAILTSCTGAGTGPAAATSPPATPLPPYSLTPRSVRDFEVPLKQAVAAVGKLKITPIGLRTGMCCVVGTHAEWPAKGQYVYVRVQIQNADRDRQEFDGTAQFLLTADGQAHKIDINAMNVKRQGFKISMGAGNVLEMDLIYDIPKETAVKAIRFTGTVTSAVGGLKMDTQQRDIPLPPSSR